MLLLLSARKAILLEQPTTLSRSLAFLHQDYQPSVYWWETVETSKKARYPPLPLYERFPPDQPTHS